MGHLKNMVSSWITKTNIENYHHKKLTLSQKISPTGSIFLLVIKMSQPTASPLPPLLETLCHNMYRTSQKCKTDILFDISNQFFLNWLFSWESSKEIFHKIGLTSETKKFTIQKNTHHLGHVKLVFWLVKSTKNLDMRCIFFT